MATETSQQTNKKKVFFKMKKSGRYTEYAAVYEDLKLWGKTVGEKNEIKSVVKRIVFAEFEPPWDVIKAAIELAEYVGSVATATSTTKEVRGAATVEIGLDKLKLNAVLYQHVNDDADDDEDEIVWRGEVSALFIGIDGLIGSAMHKVIKQVSFGEEVDVSALNRELLRVARHAYNAHDPY